jgi:glycosidase
MRWKRSSAPDRGERAVRSPGAAWRAAVAGAAAIVASCTHAPAAEDGCLERFWVRPADRGARVELVGSWDGFARPGIALTARDDGWFTVAKALPPGPVRYAFVVDGRWTRDVTEPLEETVRGEPVTRRDVRDCALPQVGLARVRAEAGAIRFDATLTAGGDGTPITALAARDLASGTETPIAFEPTTRGTVAAAIPLPYARRVGFEVIARDALGREARARTFTWTDGLTDADRIGYQILPDRFRGDGGTALAAPSPLAGRAGGTLRGITAELRAGTLQELATNTVWLMPIVQNTRDYFDIGDGALGTGYHGYWTTSASAIEPSLGTEADLRELLEEAHARGVRVVLDVVPNHVHDEHPYWRSHPEWFRGSPGSCICGSAACPWDTAIERCWFAPYMPDLDWSVPEAAEAMTADTVAWLERFPFDGLRIDAVPMMPRGATRAIVQRARAKVANGSADLLTLGEIFTGPGAYDVLRFYLGPFGLSSTFHFPLFWALRGSLVAESEPLSAIARVLAESDLAFGGSGALLTTFVGSHDVGRTASLASDSTAGRFDVEPFPTDARTWSRLRLAFGALYTLPGAPMLYQGDELGMPGTGDPVTRLPLPGRATLPAESRALEAHVRALAKLRACAPSLRRGALEVLLSSDEALVFARTDAASGDRALVALTRAPSAPLRVSVPVAFRGGVREYFQGDTTSLADELTISSAPTRTVRIWLPSESPCRAP